MLWLCIESGFNQSVNQSSFYSANIPGEVRLSGFFDALNGSKMVKVALNAIHKAVKLIKFSPRRGDVSKFFKAAEMSPGSPGIGVLRHTRWAVRADALANVLKNYPALKKT